MPQQYQGILIDHHGNVSAEMNAVIESIFFYLDEIFEPKKMGCLSGGKLHSYFRAIGTPEDQNPGRLSPSILTAYYEFLGIPYGVVFSGEPVIDYQSFLMLMTLKVLKDPNLGHHMLNQSVLLFKLRDLDPPYGLWPAIPRQLLPSSPNAQIVSKFNQMSQYYMQSGLMQVQQMQNQFANLTQSFFGFPMNAPVTTQRSIPAPQPIPQKVVQPPVQVQPPPKQVQPTPRAEPPPKPKPKYKLKCGNGHLLKEQPTRYCNCDVCGAAVTGSWYCQPCDYDVCFDCAPEYIPPGLQCKKGHLLEENSTRRCICDECRENATGAMTCMACDYDMCFNCARKATPPKTAPVPVATPDPPSPAPAQNPNSNYDYDSYSDSEQSSTPNNNPSISPSPSLAKTKKKLPKKAEDWTVDDVCAWMSSLNLSQSYDDILRENHVNGKALLTMTAKEDWQELNVTVFGDLRIITSTSILCKQKTKKSDSGSQRGGVFSFFRKKPSRGKVSDLQSDMNPRLRSTDGLDDVVYKPIIKLTESDYKPPFSCHQHIVNDLSPVLTGVQNLSAIVEDCIHVAKSRLEHLPSGIPVLSLDEALAIAVYSYDLGVEQTAKNFYHTLNRILRERDPKKFTQLKPYLFYLANGLNKLPAFEVTVFRGIPKSEMKMVKTNYRSGVSIHWSGFTSATSNIEKAKSFAQLCGIIFRIKIMTGRSIKHYSAIPSEDEILLSPNTKLIVAGSVNEESDGYYYVDLVEQLQSSTFVF